MPASLRLFADYFQIHVLDAEGDGDLSDAWTDQASTDCLAVAAGVLGLGTAVNVDVTFELLPQAPDDDSSHFDHVVEASIRVPSGQLVVMGCTDYFPDAARFDVPAGWVRDRASRWNLESAAQADVESDEAEKTMERLRIEAWSAPQATSTVVKRWQRPGDTAQSA